LFGKANLNIPAGTRSHTIFKLQGEGMPVLGRNSKGDQLVRVIIDVPRKISKKQKDLLIQFDKEGEKKGLFEL
jgi:molecular chaperone DnaJ